MVLWTPHSLPRRVPKDGCSFVSVSLCEHAVITYRSQASLLVCCLRPLLYFTRSYTGRKISSILRSHSKWRSDDGKSWGGGGSRRRMRCMFCPTSYHGWLLAGWPATRVFVKISEARSIVPHRDALPIRSLRKDICRGDKGHICQGGRGPTCRGVNFRNISL
jgi:hypothetical protein